MEGQDSQRSRRDRIPEKEQLPTRSVRDFVLNSFKNDLGIKVEALPSEHQDKGRQLAELFQRDILNLATTRAQDAQLNTAQMHYVRSLVLEAFEFHVHPQGQVVSQVDFEKTLAAATYINSLERP